MKEPVAPSPDFEADFDALMRRAGLEIKPEWRARMLVEYAQLRMNVAVLHDLANRCPATLNLHQPITSGRIET